MTDDTTRPLDARDLDEHGNPLTNYALNRPKPRAVEWSSGTAAALEALDLLYQRPRIPLSKLPSLGKVPHAVHGMDAPLCGGLSPRMFLTVSSGSAKGGKTTVALQLADGLALYTARLLAGQHEPGLPEVLTPVVLVSEMDEAQLNARTLARWARQSQDDPAKLHRAVAETLEDAVAQAALDHRHVLVDALTCVGEDLETLVREKVTSMSEDLEQRYSLPVLPVIVLDPLHRFGPRRDEQGKRLDGVDRDDVAAAIARRLANSLNAVVIATMDTTKASATGQAGTGSAAATRGSYVATHLADATFRVDCYRAAKGSEPADVASVNGQDRLVMQDVAVVTCDHARNGPPTRHNGYGLRWNASTFGLGELVDMRVFESKPKPKGAST